MASFMRPTRTGIHNVRLENALITTTCGERLSDLAGIRFEGMHIEGAEVPVLDLHNAQELVVYSAVLGSNARPAIRLTIQEVVAATPVDYSHTLP